MVNGIIGRKVGMTQIFEDSGTAVPVTVIQAGPCPIVQLKNAREGWISGSSVGFWRTEREPHK